MNNELDFNYNECLQSYDKFGETTYVNICKNKTYTTPWGVGGWLIFIFIILICLVILSFIIWFIKEMFFPNGIFRRK